MLYSVCFILFIFLSYSVMGWFVECVFCSIDDRKLVYDRGFLLGPYCPIYGWGALYMYFFLGKYQNDPITLFIMAMVGTSILEYITSYLMEKLFRARWWDYSNRRFNIEGRICLLNSFLFGVLGLMFIYIIHPNYVALIEQIPRDVLIFVTAFVFSFYLVDNILSFTILSKLKLRIDQVRKDSTSEVDAQVREFLSHYVFFFQRLFKAFPKFQMRSGTGVQITNILRNSLEKIEKESRKYLHKIEKMREKNRRRIVKIKLKLEKTKSLKKQEKLKRKLHDLKKR